MIPFPRRATLWLLAGFASSAFAAEKADVVVALDGSGDFKSIQAAVMSAPYHPGPEKWTIQVKPGDYHERVFVQQERGHLRLIGDDPSNTRLFHEVHANLPGPDGRPIGTFGTATLTIDGPGFEVENMTIENAAGPVGQALALKVNGDRVVFRNCRFLGWQDTIFLNRGRQYFENCYIAGHVDFIFGAATTWFENCTIHCLRNGYVTAASTPPGQAFGFVFHGCRITGEEGVKSYLGRPWRSFSMTAFVECELSEVIRPEGWNNWNKPDSEKDFRYIECANTGPGADTGKRVDFAKLLDPGQAADFTAAKVLAGDDGWNPQREAGE